jgi:phenylacetate-CoA ligase
MIRELLELRKALRNQKRTPYDLEALRERKLRAVIRNAYDHVPYYRSLFHEAGLSPEDIRTVEDLKKVPVTTKDDLRAAGLENRTARWADLSKCHKRVTSGSTGKPFAAHVTDSELKTLRMVQMAAVLSIGFGPRDRYAHVGGAQTFPRRLHHRLGMYRRKAFPISLPTEVLVRRLKEYQPTIVLATPSALRSLLHNLDYPLSRAIRPRIFISGGEVFDNMLKNRIADDLDAEWFDSYGAYECGQIAWECTRHEGLHVNSDYVILECLQGEEAVQREQTGTAIITNLFAFAQPFIRYKLGDLCRPLNRQCSCGRSLPLIDHPIGREEDMVKLPSGKLITANLFHYVLAKFTGIDQWRVIQESEDRFVLKLVMPSQPDGEMLRQLKATVLEYLLEPVSVDIQVVDFMEEGKTKFRTFISKIPPLP